MKTAFNLNSKELSCVLINLITVKMFFSFPKTLVTNAGNAAWIQCIYVSLIAITLFLLTLKLYEKTDMKSIIELSDEIGGKVLKIIVGIAIILIFTANVSVTVRSFPETVKNVLLPLSPMEIILLLFAFSIALASFGGFFSIARIHAIYIPIAGIMALVLLLLLTPYVKSVNIAPLFAKGTYNIFIKGIPSISIFQDILILYILLPFCKNYSATKKSATFSIIISSVFCTVIVLFYNLIYPNPAAQDFIFPIYQMTRLIKIGEFFQRLDAFFEFFWSISMLLYSSFYLCIICYVFKKIFSLKDAKPLIVPFTIIITCISYIPSSIVEVLNAVTSVYMLTVPFSFLIPLIIAPIYSKKQNKLNKKRKL